MRTEYCFFFCGFNWTKTHLVRNYFAGLKKSNTCCFNTKHEEAAINKLHPVYRKWHYVVMRTTSRCHSVRRKRQCFKVQEFQGTTVSPTVLSTGVFVLSQEQKSVTEEGGNFSTESSIGYQGPVQSGCFRCHIGGLVSGQVSTARCPAKHNRLSPAV
jgi:hypothetical protein